MAVWDHHKFGNPLQDGYRVSIVGRTSSKNTHGGTVRTRANNLYVSASISMKFYFTKSMMADFVEFYEQDMFRGTNPVSMVLLTAFGFEIKNVLFTGGYDFQLKGNGYILSIKAKIVDYETPFIPGSDNPENAILVAFRDFLASSDTNYVRYE